MRPFIPVCRPLVFEEECEAASRVIRSGWLSTGREAKLFEQELMSVFGGYVVAVSSASIGLMMALVAHGVGPGDEVIVPAISFVATSHAVLHVGATVVFADVEESTGLLSIEDTARRITNRTRAIIPVDLYGQRIDAEAFRRLGSDRKDIVIIEDAAQAFGTTGVHSRPGITTIFSFYATKNVTSGEGGAVLTEDRLVSDRLRLLSNQGVTADAYNRYNMSAPYDVIEIGYKGNLPDILAAIGRVQLTREPAMREMRRLICERYRRELSARTISWNVDTNSHLYPIFVMDRGPVRDRLNRLGVGTGVHFECVPGHAAYRRLGFDPADTPIAMGYGEEEMTLPTFAGLTSEAQTTVIEAVREVLGATAS